MWAAIKAARDAEAMAALLSAIGEKRQAAADRP